MNHEEWTRNGEETFTKMSQKRYGKNSCSFSNSCIHSSPFWAFRKIHSIHPLGAHTFFSQKSAHVLNGEILASSFLKSVLAFSWPKFLSLSFLFCFCLFLLVKRFKKGLKIVCKSGTVGIRDYMLWKTRCATKSTQDLHFFSVSYKTWRSKYDNAW